MPLKIFEKLSPGNDGYETRVDRSTRLPFQQKVFYSLGHILNDLWANFGYSYLLLFLSKVVSLSNKNAGLVLLLGQVADGVVSPFIGYASDKTNLQCYGRRKLWHLIGTIFVLMSFPFCFNLCLNCENASPTVRVFYYSIFAMIYNFGWAAGQISHLSLIPDIAKTTSEKVELNTIRSGLYFLSGIYVYVIAWLLLGKNPEERVTRNLAPQFMQLSLIVTGTGLITSLLFHIGTKEPRNYVKSNLSDIETQVSGEPINQELKDEGSFKQESSIIKSDEKGIDNDAFSVPEDPSNCKPINRELNTKESLNHECSVIKCNEKEKSPLPDIVDDAISEDNVLKQPNHNAKFSKIWKEVFRSSFFYKLTTIYMFSRLTLNISMAYLVLYLTETLAFEKESIAYFPLLVLVCGAIASMLVKVLTKKIGLRFTFITGCLLALISFVWLFVIPRDARKSVYAAAVFMGSGCSIMFVTSLAIMADVIGSQKDCLAFVYSSITFTDKLLSGIVIYVIQVLKPNEDSGTFTRYVQTVVTGTSCLISLGCIVFLFPSDYPKKDKGCSGSNSNTSSIASNENCSSESVQTTDAAHEKTTAAPPAHATADSGIDKIVAPAVETTTAQFAEKGCGVTTETTVFPVIEIRGAQFEEASAAAIVKTSSFPESATNTAASEANTAFQVMEITAAPPIGTTATALSGTDAVRGIAEDVAV